MPTLRSHSRVFSGDYLWLSACCVLLAALTSPLAHVDYVALLPVFLCFAMVLATGAPTQSALRQCVYVVSRSPRTSPSVDRLPSNFSLYSTRL